MEKIVAFDIETPNCYNDKICSIGITVIKNRDIIDSKYYLVNPECEFDYRNIQIHGINQKDVIESPTFPEIWTMIRDLFCSNLIATHNAAFDLCVLRKTLQYYGIYESLVYYIDTMAMARTNIDKVENHKLPTLCEWFGIALNHHHAGSDSYACAELLCRMLNSGVDLDRHIRSYDLNVTKPPVENRKSRRLSADNRSLLTLNGILSGITCDDVLVEAEINYLQKWMDDNAALKGNYPYDEIYSTIMGVLADGILEKSELDYMLQLFKQITDPVNESACTYDCLDICGKTICLTGEFDRGSREEISEKLTSYGAYIHTSVTQKTNILLVGGQGSCAWYAGNYGTKVKKALELQAKGINILLIREADFFAAIGE